MLYLVLALVVLGIVAALAQVWLQRHGKAQPEVKVAEQDCATCDGVNAKCEQECMMEAAVRDVEYFDDEELDRFRGRPSDGYSDAEAEQFVEVMETMQPTEVKEWNRSLILRGINMPDQIKDEFISLANGE